MLRNWKLLLYFVTTLALVGLPDISLAQKGGGKTTLKLSLTVSPSTILEGSTATGTVTHNNSSTSSAVTATLSSSDTTEATVPASITIPAGSNSATFTVTAVNDSIVDGNQPATISASATGYTAASTTVTVSDKPAFVYRTEVIPSGNNSVGRINGITNNSRVYGWMSRTINGVTEYKSGFVYDQFSKDWYDLNQIPAITAQVQNLELEPGVKLGAGFGLNSIVGMNESGLMTGWVENLSNSIGYGVAIDTIKDEEYSSDPADWRIKLLPNFGSTYTWGRRINELGDIVGVFQRPDLKYGVFLCNPWTDAEPKELLNVALYSAFNVELNDGGVVAGCDDQRRAFLYDPTTNQIKYFVETSYTKVNGLSNFGVFSGTATVPGANRRQTTSTAFRHDGTYRPIGSSTFAAEAVSLNEANDLAYFSESSRKSMLSHRGFAPDFMEQQFSLTSSIATDDPLKAHLVANEPSVYAINDRDNTGFPQLVVLTTVSSTKEQTVDWAIILTPLVP
jgi:hypothetical protein